MKHIKKFKQLNEGTLNEVHGKKTEWRYDEERFDPDLKEILTAITSVVEESPITFDMDLGEDRFVVQGPFGISMRVELDKEKNPNSSSFNPSYNKVGVKAVIDKKTIKAESPTDLWDKLQKSYEFKQFVKGAKVEKMREGRMRNILKDGKGRTMDEQDRLILDYLYYMTPEMITNKSDNSGPYATTSTSIRTYKYNLTPIVRAWEGKMKKTKLDNPDAQKIYDDMIKNDGYYYGKLKPDVKLSLEKNPLIDIDDLGDGNYDVYTYTQGTAWSTRIEDLRNDIVERLGYKSRYMVDEKVTQFLVTELDNKFDLVIKVETTVWQN